MREVNIRDIDSKLKALNSKRIGLFVLNAVIIIAFSVLYFKLAFYLRDHYHIHSRIIRYASLPLIYIIYSYLKGKKSGFNQLYNGFILEDIIQSLYPGWSYNEATDINPDLVYETQLVQKGSSIDITNCLVGDIGKTDFSFAELKILKNQYLGARLPKKLFHGYFFIFSNNKVIDSKLYIKPIGLNDFSGVVLQQNKIKTDSSEFDQRFATYSDDPVKARYILTPALMARMIDFEKQYKNKISFLFYNDKLYIAFKGYKNFLEPALHKKITVDSIDKQVGIFELIGMIVVELNIDNQIWMKEAKVGGR